MRTYWLTLAITEDELAKEMGVAPEDIQAGDYIGAIRDFGEVVSLKEVEDVLPLSPQE